MVNDLLTYSYIKDEMNNFYKVKEYEIRRVVEKLKRKSIWIANEEDVIMQRTGTK